MTLTWLTLCWFLTVDKCSSTILLLMCRWYEIIYFIYSENLQEILWITFIKKHTDKFTQIYQINHSIKSILSFLQWRATSNQLSHEQLICLEALLVNEFFSFLSMLQLTSRTLIFHETSRQKNSFVNELMISQTRSSRCWTSLNFNKTWFWNSINNELLFKLNMTRDWIN